MGKLLQKHHLVFTLNHLIKSLGLSLPPSSSCCLTQTATSEDILSSLKLNALRNEPFHLHYSVHQSSEVINLSVVFEEADVKM